MAIMKNKMLELNKIYCCDCVKGMQHVDDESIDLLVTDPPYGLSFMGKDWDKAVPSVEIWQESLRVLKQGAFAFIMCIPRQDCLSHMIVNLEDAGFNTNFTSIYWTYATGFPKAQNISKAIDKNLGAKVNEGKGFKTAGEYGGRNLPDPTPIKEREQFRHKAKTPEAKALDGSYAGFQPKPAVEVVIVAMKPLSEKTYVAQALKNGKGIMWLDEGRIPFKNNEHPETVTRKKSKLKQEAIGYVRYDEPLFGGTGHQSGRFPANLLVEDDVLNDGRIIPKSRRENVENRIYKAEQNINFYGNNTRMLGYTDEGSFSRYFDLDAWFAEKIKQLPEEVQKTFPFLIVPKASKSEKNKGCEGLQTKQANPNYGKGGFKRPTGEPKRVIAPRGNHHPTVKPIKLMSYLITIGSREGDIILDPFAGSGTTLLAAQTLRRNYIGFEINPEYVEIANKRLAQSNLSL